ncbi:hypothetical protein [Streptomyces sp. NBC_00996]|uniref:hypothetical protein n=1 Tax=Streptomyces sp. NBC_00996 TaxID=2903710 RepID=UPI003863CB86|nr:hypothetical protein OG390_17270 [Streptomyces sp. NBC_00996]
MPKPPDVPPTTPPGKGGGRDIAARARNNRATRHRARINAQVHAEETTCCHCGGHVDPTLTGTHPWAGTVDQPRPLWASGNPNVRANNRLAHQLCQGAHQQQLRVAGQTRGGHVARTGRPA